MTHTQRSEIAKQIRPGVVLFQGECAIHIVAATKADALMTATECQKLLKAHFADDGGYSRSLGQWSIKGVVPSPSPLAQG